MNTETQIHVQDSEEHIFGLLLNLHLNNQHTPGYNQHLYSFNIQK
jgi:hypothetical protein